MVLQVKVAYQAVRQQKPRLVSQFSDKVRVFVNPLHTIQWLISLVNQPTAQRGLPQTGLRGEQIFSRFGKLSSLSALQDDVLRILHGLFHSDNPHASGELFNQYDASVDYLVGAYANAARRSGIHAPGVIVFSDPEKRYQQACLRHQVQLQIGEPHQIQQSLSPQTVLIICQMPDPQTGEFGAIREISRLACRARIGLHIETDHYGLWTQFVSMAGLSIPICDFRIEGVTSISTRCHRYGYTPKELYAVLLRSPALLFNKRFTQSDFGTKLALAWTVFNVFGREVYIRRTRDVLILAQSLRFRLQAYHGLTVSGDLMTPILHFHSNRWELSSVARALQMAGWQITRFDSASAFTLTLTYGDTEPAIHYVQRFTADLQQALRTQLGAGSYAHIVQDLPGTNNGCDVPPVDTLENKVRVMLSRLYQPPTDITVNSDSFQAAPASAPEPPCP